MAVRWADVAALLRGRIGKQCRERWFNHLDPTINRGAFTPAEDMRLFELRRVHGAFVDDSRATSKVWLRLSPYPPYPRRFAYRLHHKLPRAGCVVHNINYKLSRAWCVVCGVRCAGNKWSEIAKYMAGRSENAVKNRWNSAARRRWFVDNGLALDERDAEMLAPSAASASPALGGGGGGGAPATATGSGSSSLGSGSSFVPF